MSRWIDGEWILNFFEPYPNDYHTPLGTLRACVDDAPNIEIICCRECKHSEKTSSPITALWCKRFGLEDMAVEADDFCSYGSRSEKPNNSKERSSE